MEWGINLKLLNKKSNRAFSIKFHIWLNFVFFILCVILLFWIFQILFLQNFYERTRTHSTEEAAAEMTNLYNSSSIIDDKSFSQLTEKFDIQATENDFSYMILDYYGRTVYENNVSIRYQFSKNELSYMFQSANVKNGSFVQIIDGVVSNSKMMIICSVLKNSSGEVDGYLVVDSIITPVNTTINLLKQNTYIITVILVIISIFISLILSQSIANPISKITKSADKLAKGEYNTEFDGGKYKETRQLAKTLNYASAEISKIDELQRDLIANVSHDLRTPLTMIKAYAEMIRDLSGDRKEKREEHLKIIIDETDRLAALVNDMLDLSKLENGSQPLNFTTFDINSKLRDIISRYDEFTSLKGYTINFTDETPVFVKCDIVKIEQVIYNLVNNAINYTGEDKQIYITQAVEDEFVKITITDTGKGISEDNIHQIFDKYYRCEKTRREVVGTGLGLSIVKAILKNHNFPFGVQSTPGVGTSFWFKVKIDKDSICVK